MQTPKQTTDAPGTSFIGQLLPVLALQELSANRGENSNGSGKSVKAGVLGLIFLDAATKMLPKLGAAVCGFVACRLRARTTRMMQAIQGASMERKKGSMVMERVYSSTESAKDSDDAFDAVLTFASDLPQTRFIRRLEGGMFLVDTEDEIILTEGVFFKRTHFSQKDGRIEVKIEVFSYEKDVVQIRDYVNELEDRFLSQRSNQLGRSLFYFNEIAQSKPPNNDLTRCAQHITFTMFPMHTTKNLDNVYGAAAKQVAQRVRFFMNNRQWYEQRGIPYTLGIMLHGAPGCGKTSIIKAIAKDTQRHIINIKLTQYTTVTQLTNLFYSSRINVVQAGRNVSYDIPLGRCVIVIEDIDCLTDIVLRRDVEKVDEKPVEAGGSIFKAESNVVDNILKLGIPKTIEEQEKMLSEMARLKQLKENHSLKAQLEEEKKEGVLVGESERLNLSILLNLLDGILETPGRILIITTNHPEKLDPALIRPGRIDSSVEFSKCTVPDIVEMIESVCDTVVSLVEPLPADVWTPAQVMQIIFEHIGSVKDMLHALRTRNPNTDGHEKEASKNVIYSKRDATTCDHAHVGQDSDESPIHTPPLVVGDYETLFGDQAETSRGEEPDAYNTGDLFASADALGTQNCTDYDGVQMIIAERKFAEYKFLEQRKFTSSNAIISEERIRGSHECNQQFPNPI